MNWEYVKKIYIKFGCGLEFVVWGNGSRSIVLGERFFVAGRDGTRIRR